MEKLSNILEESANHKPLTDDNLDIIARRFKILSEPSRLKILRSLFDGERTVTEIIGATGLLQANVSKQLGILSNGGIVECRPEGLLRYYRIVDFTVEKICYVICAPDGE